MMRSVILSVGFCIFRYIVILNYNTGGNILYSLKQRKLNKVTELLKVKEVFNMADLSANGFRKALI